MGFWNWLSGGSGSDLWNTMILGGIGGGSTLIKGLTGQSQEEWNQKQYELQRDTLNYNKWLNQEQMKREDETYQRTMSDMMAAGLNPNLALGGSAGAISSSAGSSLNSGASISAQNNSSLLQIFQAVQQAKDIESGIQLKSAQSEAANAQKNVADQQAEGQKLKNEWQQAENDFQKTLQTTQKLKEMAEALDKMGAAVLKSREIMGRELDGTYPNQPMENTSVSGSILGSGVTYSSSKPYKKAEPPKAPEAATKPSASTQDIRNAIESEMKKDNGHAGEFLGQLKAKQNPFTGKTIPDKEAEELENWFREKYKVYLGGQN